MITSEGKEVLTMAEPTLKQVKFYQYLRYMCRQWGCGSRLPDTYPKTSYEMVKAIQELLEITRKYDVPIKLAPQTRKEIRRRKKQAKYKTGKPLDRQSLLS